MTKATSKTDSLKIATENKKSENAFKIVKHLKIDWLKNASADGGAMEFLIKSKKPNQITVHLHTNKNGRMWSNIKSHELLKLVQKNNGIFEVITQYPHKIYFDIDKKVDENNNTEIFYEKIINKINNIFPNSDMAVSGSVNENKISYHITLNNYLIKTKEDREYVKNVVKYLNETFDNSFDWKVYTNNRNMKAVNQSKIDGRIQNIILNNNIEKHMITCFFNGLTFPLPLLEIRQPAIKLQTTY